MRVREVVRQSTSPQQRSGWNIPRKSLESLRDRFLGLEHAIACFARVKALRRVGKPSAASKPMIGFGNPLLDGPDARYAGRAKLAREKQGCQERGRSTVAVLAGLRGGVQRSRRGAAWPTCRTSRCKCLCPRPPTSCALWPRM